MKKKKDYLILGIASIAIVLVIYLPKILKGNSDFDNKKIILKDNYKVNEFIPVYVDDQQMSIKYLNDYINNVYRDINKSYELLNIDYRNSRFGSVEKYKEYLESIGFSDETKVYKYSTYEMLGFKYYDILDKNNNRFIFKTNGVMQYELYFEKIDEGDDD